MPGTVTNTLIILSPHSDTAVRSGQFLTRSIAPARVEAAFDTASPGVREPLEDRQRSEASAEPLAALGYY